MTPEEINEILDEYNKQLEKAVAMHKNSTQTKNANKLAAKYFNPASEVYLDKKDYIQIRSSFHHIKDKNPKVSREADLTELRKTYGDAAELVHYLKSIID